MAEFEFEFNQQDKELVVTQKAAKRYKGLGYGPEKKNAIKVKTKRPITHTMTDRTPKGYGPSEEVEMSIDERVSVDGRTRDYRGTVKRLETSGRRNGEGIDGRMKGYRDALSRISARHQLDTPPEVEVEPEISEPIDAIAPVEESGMYVKGKGLIDPKNRGRVKPTSVERERTLPSGGPGSRSSVFKKAVKTYGANDKDVKSLDALYKKRDKTLKQKGNTDRIDKQIGSVEVHFADSMKKKNEEVFYMDKVTETYVNLDELTAKEADKLSNAARGYDEAWQEASHVGQLLRELVTSVNRLAKSPHGKTAKKYAKIFQDTLNHTKRFKTLAKSAAKDLQRQADERWKDDDDETFHAGTKKKKITKKKMKGAREPFDMAAWDPQRPTGGKRKR